ncbi:MAG: helix-turn-helix domain-containing protein [Myxococcota bacterium]
MTRWTVLIATQARTWSVELVAGRGTVVGAAPGGLEIADAGLAPRHFTLLPKDDGVLVEPLRDGGELVVNDVPATAQLVVRAGDELRAGQARLFFAVRHPPVPPRPRLVGEEEFMARLDEELRRAGASRPVGLVLIASPGLNVAARQALTRRAVDEVSRTGAVCCFGALAIELVGILLPELTAPALSALLERLPGIVGPRATVATARSPEQGLDAETLLGACWDALLGEPAANAEPIFVDPLMVRLAALLEGLADDPRPVCAIGPPGAGRRTLLEGLARAAGRRVTVVSALGRVVPASPGDWVLVRDVDRLSPQALQELIGSVRGRLLATAARPPAAGFPHLVEVPPLAARREDVLPIAEDFVSRARVAVGRPRLTLSAEARAMLTAWHWPGNVRELVNVLAFAARATARDEIGRDALPRRLARDDSGEQFKGAMAAAEREVLLEALARTRWNVTAAAARLGMPRRTIVHRMAKLGLKRPAR